MKNLHNFHVLFWLKKTLAKRDETIPIYARIKVDGIPADISTKESTLEAHWYSDLGRLNPRLKQAKGVNETLDDIEAGIKKAFKELREEGRSISAQAVKLRYLGKDKPVLTINDLMTYCENAYRALSMRSEWNQIRNAYALPVFCCTEKQPKALSITDPLKLSGRYPNH